MIISDITIREDGAHTEYSAFMDDFRLWYRVPAGFRPANLADTFLAAAFFPASRTGEPIRFEPRTSVSARLADGFPYLQEVFGCWNPAFQPFPIDADTVAPKPADEAVGAFFSGGVDSLYTAKRHEHEVIHLIYANGLDFFQMPSQQFQAYLERIEQVAATLGKRVVPVETNLLEYVRYHRLGKIWTHGASLASIALLLGLRQCYVPSSYTYNQLHAWGTHPLTDHHWSTEATEIRHDTAAVSRAQKIQALADRPEVLEQLVVCWELPDRNCGACGKCLRTMTTLRLLGVETRAFPRPITPAEIARLEPTGHADELFFLDNLALAEQLGHEPIRRALAHALREHPFKRLVRDIDNAALGGTLRRLYKRLGNREEAKRSGQDA